MDFGTPARASKDAVPGTSQRQRASPAPITTRLPAVCFHSFIQFPRRAGS